MWVRGSRGCGLNTDGGIVEPSENSTNQPSGNWSILTCFKAQLKEESHGSVTLGSSGFHFFSVLCQLRNRNILIDKLNPVRANLSASYGHGMSHVEGFSTAGYEGLNHGKISADYAIFKGKAALLIAPISPKVDRTLDGWTRIKKGGLFFKFMPAIGTRKYDYEKRQGFSLSPQEVGSLISLGVDEGCDFVHDPSMKTSDAGKIIKRFSVQPLDDHTGYFIRLSVTDNNTKSTQTIAVPVTKAEFAVIRTAGSYILPTSWAGTF